MRFLIINGPNMNMLGIREKEKYGAETLSDICISVEKIADALNIDTDFFQSNIEGEIINSIHNALGVYDGIVINPAAYSHYSIAILDALNAVNIPTVEVHMTNIFAREEYRNHTVTAPGCVGVISGFGKSSYTLAIRALYSYIIDRRCGIDG